MRREEDIDGMVKVISQERRDKATALREQTNTQLVCCLEHAVELIDLYKRERDAGKSDADRYLNLARDVLTVTMGEKR
jgi:hypothetical protein